MPGLPFAGEVRVTVVLPPADPTLGGRLPLLELERAGFEAELGASVEFASAEPEAGPRWRLVLDPQQCGPAVTTWDPRGGVITSRAPDVDGLLEALNLWRTLRRRGGGSVEATDCADRGEAIERVVAEVPDTYPAFELRGLDWPTICERHVERVRRADDALEAFQRWVAELQDAHTWVWPGHGNLPYVLRVAAGAATFVHVPPRTAGRRAGVSPGWRLVAVDETAVDADGWLARTAAPPHSRPYLAGRRLLAGPSGKARLLTAADPQGRAVAWEESPVAAPVDPVVTWRRTAGGSGFVHVAAWLEDGGIDDAIDAALAELRSCEKLILDLRGNPGGSLLLASSVRDRFLRAKTALGSIRYSVGGGGLSEPAALSAAPAPEAMRWRGRLVALTDELTFSSSEDFLLGLQGLDHVTVVGRPSGGGSGRPRTLRLVPGWRLTVSTALTFDREGRCVEGAGIPVDVPLPADGRTDVDLALEFAATL
jgi:carboxyl-terminal processing protease